MNRNSALAYSAWTKAIHAAALAVRGSTDSSSAMYSARSTLSGSAGSVKPGLSATFAAAGDAISGAGVEVLECCILRFELHEELQRPVRLGRTGIAAHCYAVGLRNLGRVATFGCASSDSASDKACFRTNEELRRNKACAGTVVASRRPVTRVCVTGSKAWSPLGVKPRTKGRYTLRTDALIRLIMNGARFRPVVLHFDHAKLAGRERPPMVSVATLPP